MFVSGLTRVSFPVIYWCCFCTLGFCKIVPCYLSASTWDRSLSSGAEAWCLPSRLPAGCGQVCVHCTHLQKDWISGFQSRCLKSTGERRQQPCAGWCLPKCGLRAGWSDWRPLAWNLVPPGCTPILNSSFKTRSNLSSFDSLPVLSLSQVDKWGGIRVSKRRII